MPTVGTYLELVPLLTVSIGLLILCVTTLFGLRRKGGFELGLAHVVADPRRRRIFLGGLSTSLAALFGVGFACSLEAILGTPLLVIEVSLAALFLAGATGMVVLMTNAFQTAPLTYAEEWSLKETAERVSLSSTMVGYAHIRAELDGPSLLER